MNIQYGHGVIPLLDFVQGWEAYGNDRIFECEGNIYLLFGGLSSTYCEVSVDEGRVPVFNLKSHTVRGLLPTALVRPLVADPLVVNYLRTDQCTAE